MGNEEEEKQNWKIVGYISSAIAAYNADKRGEAGLTGSGQECGPLCLDYSPGCRGYVYVTWDNRWIVPGGVVDEKLQVEVMTR